MVLSMKVNRRQKVLLVTAASHFVVSWLQLLKFKCRYLVSGDRFDTAMSFRVFIMKVNRGQKVRLVTATSHFVVSWLLLLKFKCRYVVSGDRFDTAMSLRLFICIMVCRCVIMFLQCSISSRNHCFIVSSLRFVFAYEPS